MTLSPSTLPPKYRIKVKVVPRASRTEFAGWLGDRLKVRIAAAPEHGRANAALVSHLASVLKVPRRDIKLVSGLTAADKVVEIEGIDASMLSKLLPPP